MVMVMVMEKITRHLLSGGRMLDLWTSPEATPAGQGEGPALDHAEILLRLRIVPLAATTAARVFAAAGRHAPPPEGGLQHHRLLWAASTAAASAWSRLNFPRAASNTTARRKLSHGRRLYLQYCSCAGFWGRDSRLSS